MVKAAAKDNSNKLDWEQQKKEQAKIRKQENAIKKIEEQIETCENQIAEIDESLSDPAIATNSAKLNELSAERDVKQKELDELYEKWEELSAALEV